MTLMQINRNFKLTIGDGVTREAVIITPPMSVSFSVNKSSDNKNKQNSGEIQIYNLSDETLKLLEGDFPLAILEVGYMDTPLVTILIGEAVSVTTKKQGADKVTQILIGSGYVTLNHDTVSATVPEGSTVRQVIETLQKEMKGISKGVFSGVNIQNRVLYGYSMNGTSRETLDNICKTYHLDYSIDNNILYVHDSAGTIDENYGLAPLINESSGLIDLPYYTRVDVGKAKKSVDNKGGVHFQILLNPLLVAGSIVRVESSTVTGWFKISDLRHYGGNRGNDWFTDCKCVDKSSPVTDDTPDSIPNDEEM